MPANIYFLVEEAGSTDLGRIEIPFPSTISMADAQDLVTAILPILYPLLNGRIAQAGVSFGLDIGASGLNVTAAIADLRDKARFAFSASGAAGIFPKLMTLPTYNEDYTLPGTKELDITDPDVDAFVDLMVSGIAVVSGTIQPVDSREYDLFSLRYAVEL